MPSIHNTLENKGWRGRRCRKFSNYFVAFNFQQISSHFHIASNFTCEIREEVKGRKRAIQTYHHASIMGILLIPNRFLFPFYRLFGDFISFAFLKMCESDLNTITKMLFLLFILRENYFIFS